jgi:hypothetical protein
MTSGWAKALADAKKIELRDRDLKDRKDLSDREFLGTYSGKMWDEVWVAAKESVNDLNQEMQKQVLFFNEVMLGNGIVDAYSFEIRSAKNHLLVRFSPERGTLSSTLDGVYTLAIVTGNSLIWRNQQGNTTTSENLAHKIVQTAFQSV